MNVSKEYFNIAIDVMNQIEATQSETIEKVSQMFAQCIANDGLVYVYGSGHSRMGVEEMFPRYGSFAGFYPIVELSTSYYHNVVGANGLSQVMFLENVEGFAKQIIKNFIIKPQDMFLLFSTSGNGNVVIDMAIEAKKLDVPVVAITGVKNSGKAPSRHSSKQKLFDVADIVIDTCVPVGDSAIKIEGLKYPVGPVSTIANSVIVNMIKVRVAELLTKKGQPPYVLTSAQVVGVEEAKESFEGVYREHRRRINR